MLLGHDLGPMNMSLKIIHHLKMHCTCVTRSTKLGHQSWKTALAGCFLMGTRYHCETGDNVCRTLNPISLT